MMTIATEAVHTGSTVGRDLGPDHHLLMILARKAQKEKLTVVRHHVVPRIEAVVVLSLLKRSATTDPLAGEPNLVTTPNDRAPQRRPIKLFLLVE